MGVIVEGVGLAGFSRPYRPLRKKIANKTARSMLWLAHSFGWPNWMRDQIVLAALNVRPIIGGSLGDTFENDLLALIFNATAIADLAENDTTSPATTLTVALHTADPGEAGTQTTNEAAYTSYARQTVARTSGGWTVSTNTVVPAANIDFPEATGGSETETHFSIGTGVSNKLLMSGTITPNIVVSTGVTPRLNTSTQVSLD